MTHYTDDQTTPNFAWKNLGVAGPNILSFIVGVCKYFIQWHILRVAGLNEDPVFTSPKTANAYSHLT